MTFTKQYVVLVRLGNTKNPGRYHVHATSEAEAIEKTKLAYKGNAYVTIDGIERKPSTKSRR